MPGFAHNCRRISFGPDACPLIWPDCWPGCNSSGKTPTMSAMSRSTPTRPAELDRTLTVSARRSGAGCERMTGCGPPRSFPRGRLEGTATASRMTASTASFRPPAASGPSPLRKRCWRIPCWAFGGAAERCDDAWRRLAPLLEKNTAQSNWNTPCQSGSRADFRESRRRMKRLKLARPRKQTLCFYRLCGHT